MQLRIADTFTASVASPARQGGLMDLGKKICHGNFLILLGFFKKQPDPFGVVLPGGLRRNVRPLEHFHRHETGEQFLGPAKGRFHRNENIRFGQE